MLLHRIQWFTPLSKLVCPSPTSPETTKTLFLCTSNAWRTCIDKTRGFALLVLRMQDSPASYQLNLPCLRSYAQVSDSCGGQKLSCKRPATSIRSRVHGGNVRTTKLHIAGKGHVQCLHPHAHHATKGKLKTRGTSKYTLKQEQDARDLH